MVNKTALGTLLDFLQRPSQFTATRLLMIPSYHSIVLLELDAILKEGANSNIWKIGKWIYKRAFAVQSSVCHYGYPEANDAVPQENDDWKKVRFIRAGRSALLICLEDRSLLQSASDPSASSISCFSE